MCREELKTKHCLLLLNANVFPEGKICQLCVRRCLCAYVCSFSMMKHKESGLFVLLSTFLALQVIRPSISSWPRRCTLKRVRHKGHQQEVFEETQEVLLHYGSLIRQKKYSSVYTQTHTKDMKISGGHALVHSSSFFLMKKGNIVERRV